MKKVFLFTMITIISLIFISCENFLNGDNLKKDLDTAIEIANEPTVTITITSDYGSINSLGSALYKKNVSYPLIFTPFTEYAFIEWRVYIKNTNKEIKNYSSLIKIDDIRKASTSFSALSVENQNIEIRPFCVERPVVLNTTPTYSSSGSYRDEPIVVWFDSQMDENSIYYTINEIPEGKYPVYSSKNGFSDRIVAYGDKDPEDENKIINREFKNIKILNLLTQVSVADCYCEPFFENPTKLVITPDSSNLPPLSTQIIVNISKGMTATKEGVSINLYKAEKWNYLTNVNTDQDKPGFIDISGDKIKVEIDNFNTLTELSAKNEHTDLASSTLKSMYLKNNKIKLYMHFQDILSGPSEGVIHYQRVYNQNYEPVTETEKFKSLTCLISGQDGYFTSDMKNKSTAEIDFSKNADGTDIEDGIYRIWFGARDKNGNEKLSYEGKDDKYYFVLKDNTAPSAKTIKYTYTNKTVSWSITEPNYTMEIKYTNKSKENQTVTKNCIKRDASYTIGFGEKNSYYYIEVSVMDIFGNNKKIYTKTTINELKQPSIYLNFDNDYWAHGYMQGPNNEEKYNGKAKIKSYARYNHLNGQEINYSGNSQNIDYYLITYVNDYGNEVELLKSTNINNVSDCYGNSTKYYSTFSIPYDKLTTGKEYTLKYRACKEVDGEIIQSEPLSNTYREIGVEMIMGYCVKSGSIYIGGGIVTDPSKIYEISKPAYRGYGDRDGNDFYNKKNDGTCSNRDSVKDGPYKVYSFYDDSSNHAHYVYTYKYRYGTEEVTFYIGANNNDNTNLVMSFDDLGRNY